jgi:kynurenine formamidase
VTEVSTRTATIDDVLKLARELSNWGRWGDRDQIGTVNFITQEKVREGSACVRQGRIISLALPFDSNGPQRGGLGRFNPMHFMMRDGGDTVTGAVLEFYGGRDRHLRGTDDLVIMATQGGTQWDGLAHIIHDNHLYNGYPAASVSSRGARFNGIENWKDRIATRGVLLDIARWKQRDWLEPGEAISIADLEACAESQGVKVTRGDIVLIRTGQIAQCRARGDWGDYAGGSAPGLAFECARWLHDTEVAGFATDTWGTEVLPNETPDVFQPLHIICIPYMGMLVGEIFDLEELAASCVDDKQYDFFLVAAPLPITGAVGSPINPLAIK